MSCRYLDLGSYAEWDEDKRIEFLTRELEGKRPLIPTAMPMTNDVREVRLLQADLARSPSNGASWSARQSDCAATHVTQLMYNNRLCDVLVSVLVSGRSLGVIVPSL